LPSVGERLSRHHIWRPSISRLRTCLPPSALTR
jgi:hypothetical protein